MVSVRTSIVPPGPCPPPEDTPGAAPAATAPQVTASIHDFAVSLLATLARWCRIRSYLDSAAAHGLTALAAIHDALAGKPWLPPLPAAA